MPQEKKVLSPMLRTMQRVEINSLLKKTLPFYLAILLVPIAVGGWNQIGFHEGFNIGDWLINYQGGFIRRGFLGEVLYQVAIVTHMSPAVLLVAFQTLIFALYFYFSWKVLQSKSDLIKYLILILSPFLFTFAINSQAGGYRKEILYFAVLAFVVYAQERYDQQKFQRIFFLVLFLYPMVLLTDEVGLVILPILVAVYWNKVNPRGQGLFLLFLLLLENAAVFFGVIMRHQASTEQIGLIVNSLIRTGYDPKGSGAIVALHDSTLINMHGVRDSILHSGFLAVYPLAILLCAIAYLPVKNEIMGIFKNKILGLGIAGSLIVFLPIFIIADDWGRWIYILLVELFMLILIVDDSSETNEKINESAEYSFCSVGIRSLLLIAYASFWYLPHFLEGGSSWRSIFHNLPFI